MTRPRQIRRTPARHGFSLTELIVTVAVLGVMAGIAISSFGNVNLASRNAQAQNITEKLNRALKEFGQSNWNITTASNAGSTTDEFKVLRSLQWKPASTANNTRIVVGAPFVSPVWNPSGSSSSTEFRVRWNGFEFDLLPPGTAGTGLKLTFDGTDHTTPYAFPNDYKPEGARW